MSQNVCQFCGQYHPPASDCRGSSAPGPSGKGDRSVSPTCAVCGKPMTPVYSEMGKQTAWGCIGCIGPSVESRPRCPTCLQEYPIAGETAQTDLLSPSGCPCGSRCACVCHYKPEPLTNLIAKWRASADTAESHIAESGMEIENETHMRDLRMCADELEALLREAAQHAPRQTKEKPHIIVKMDYEKKAVILGAAHGSFKISWNAGNFSSDYNIEEGHTFTILLDADKSGSKI